MAVRPIVVVPHEALTRAAEEITDIDDRIRKLAHDMAETMYKAPGLGLAANQVGELCQLIVIDVEYPYAEPKDRKKKPIWLINPEICLCEGQAVKQEGCLSVPEFEVDVKRSESVQVKGIGLDGKPIQIEAEGLLARVLQHEIDHLHGTTLLDHASALKRSLYRRRIGKSARRKN
ncbi:MAG: peptide deformylase [Desulfomonile tiedjei]|nr:peptide deformylase [Desulfomonile tiedjei]